MRPRPASGLSLPSPHELYRIEPESRRDGDVETLRWVYVEQKAAWRAKAEALRAVSRADEAAEAERRADALETAQRQA